MMAAGRRSEGSVCTRWGKAFFALCAVITIGSYGRTEAGVWRTDCAEVATTGPSDDPNRPFHGDIRGTPIKENKQYCNPIKFQLLADLLERMPADTDSRWTIQGIRKSDGTDCHVRPGSSKLPFMEGFCHGSSLKTVAGAGIEEFCPEL